MQKPDVITMSTITLAVSVIGGWIFAGEFFMTRDDADIAHSGFKHDIRETYLELKIDSANGELAFIEKDGVIPDEQRKYDLLKFSVERMTLTLMELDK